MTRGPGTGGGEEGGARAALPAPGAVLAGCYRLGAELGRGGFGVVFEACRTDAPYERVALKVLDPALTRDLCLRARFLREIEVATRLAHPHIVRVRDLGVTPDGLCYYTMDLVRGPSLRALLRAEGRLVPERAARIALQALAALACAHAAGVVHRDLKPENLLLDIRGEAAGGREAAGEHVLLADFGLALLLAEPGAAAARLTAPGVPLGTRPYAAPEQLAGGAVDGRADLYALGAVLFEMLTGRRPPAAGLAGAPLLPPEPGLPAALAAVLSRALAPEPRRRYPTASAMQQALEGALAPGRGTGPAALGAPTVPYAALGIDPAQPPPAGAQPAGRAGLGGDPASDGASGTPPPSPSGEQTLPLSWAPGGAPPAPPRDEPATVPLPGGPLPDPDGAPEAAAGRAPIPRVLPRGYLVGRYRIEERIGGGGMGEVYRARHVHMEREVALKVIVAELAANEVVRARFLREARVASRFRHPCVVELYDFDDLAGLCYLAMELVPGEPLSALLRREGPLAPARVGRIFEQLLDALAAAHEGGVVHRDLKPSNVMVLAGDRIKVLDFGIARMLGGESGEPEAAVTQGLTEVGDFIGTPAYAAPEQIQGLRVDGRVDLYAAGVMLFEALSGRPPFRGPGVHALLTQHLTEQPPALAELRPELERAAELDEVVQRALAKRPEERFASARAMHRALLQALGPLYEAGLPTPIASSPGGGIGGGRPEAVPLAATCPSAPAAAGAAPGQPDAPTVALTPRPPAAAGQQPPPRAVLRIAGATPRRVFLLGGTRLVFGRSRWDRRTGLRNDVVLRVLPCRSPERDPDNWEATLRLSQSHGEIGLRGQEAWVIDRSTRGSVLDGVRLERGRPAPLPDRFTLALGEGALVLESTIVRAPVERSGAAEHRGESAGPGAAGAVEAVLLRRRNNAPHHVYVLLAGGLVLGGGPGADLALAGLQPGALPARALRLALVGGSFCARALVSEPAPWLDDSPLSCSSPAPLVPGAELRCGAVTIRCAALDEQEFSEL
ncbi:MAG: hypothetical protein KatS3mg102_2311 [Planctomycetota bacterium]|nr:MAG: hypothetical protein KatS3mg102_2311 [Planctomycetota bacterium]